MAESSLELQCPKCKAMMSVSPEKAGEQISCRRCQNKLFVPGQRARPTQVSIDDLVDIDDDMFHDTSVTEANKVASSTESELKTAPESSASAPPEASTTQANRVDVDDDDDDVIGVEGLLDEDPVESEQHDDILDDLLPLGPTTGPAIPSPTASGKDPFEIDEDASLRVAGITPPTASFSTSCPLCHSLVYATRSQIGQKLRCDDCHSMVEIHPPKEAKATPPPEPDDQAAPADDDEGYRLKPAVELPEIDTRIDKSTGSIDYDDSEFFEQRRRLKSETDSRGEPVELDEQEIQFVDDDASVAPAPAVPSSAPDEAIRVEPEPPADDASYSLAPVEERPSDEGMVAGVPQVAEPTVSPSTEIGPKPGSPQRSTGGGPMPPSRRADKTIPATAVGPGPRATEPSRRDSLAAGRSNRTQASAPSSGSQATAAPKRMDSPTDMDSPFSNLGNWIGQAVKALMDVQVLIRGALSVFGIVVGYWLILTGFSYFGEEAKQIERFVGFFILALGFLPLLTTFFFVGVFGHNVMGSAFHQRSTIDEWPDFSVSEWASNFLYAATSFWLAAIPGLIFGQLFLFSLGSQVVMALCILVSCFVLTPVFLSSVLFNESPWALVSKEVYDTFGPLKNRWMRFSLIGFVTALLLTASVFAIGLGGFAALCVAVFQVALLLVYYWLLGDHVGDVVRYMVANAE